jgi:hypothetical protein
MLTLIHSRGLTFIEGRLYMVDIKIYILILAFVLNIGIKKEMIFLASIRYLMNIFKVKTTSFLKPIYRPCV